jgi:hypothetical protein
MPSLPKWLLLETKTLSASLRELLQAESSVRR